jgi:tetratricopeptide (TPR) repeat protein
VADLNLAIFYDPRQALAYNNRGLVYEALDNLIGAIADYTQAIQINPHIAVAYHNRGGARADRGDLRGAIADFQRYLALGGRDQTRIEAVIASLRGKLERQTRT